MSRLKRDPVQSVHNFAALAPKGFADIATEEGGCVSSGVIHSELRSNGPIEMLFTTKCVMSLRSPAEDENGGISLHQDPRTPIFKGEHEGHEEEIEREIFCSLRGLRTTIVQNLRGVRK